MGIRELSEITELGQLVLGAYALADTHTLSSHQVTKMSSGALDVVQVEVAMTELTGAGYAELLDDVEQVDGAEGPGYRLTRAGIEVTLQLQAALTAKS